MLGPFVCLLLAADPPADPADLAFFESKIRPLFVEQCYQCHGPSKQKGGLRLDSRSAILAGGDQGPALVPNNPKESLIVKAISYESEDLKMPPKKKLSAAQLRDVERWIARGAVWPKEAAKADDSSGVRRGAFQITAKDREHWAFRPLCKNSPPSVKGADWVETPIDRFILARLEAKKLKPNPEADKRTLIRRATFDLTGLPPTPEETAAFLADDSPAAYERLVDRLLASPAYGEKWGRHWLDLVRYAETNSYERDNAKPHAWRFRDYVVKSFNSDKPMDRFVEEQLAGDELYPGDADALVATGFYRLGLWDDEPVDPLQARYDVLDDVVATTGQVFLGLTIDCARCHDHKIDPIAQKDYYKLLAFVENVTPYHNGGKTDEAPLFESPSERAKYQQEAAYLDRRREEVQKELDGLNEAFIAKVKQSGAPAPTLRSLSEDVSRVGKKLMGDEWVAKWNRLNESAKQLSTAMPKAKLALVATEHGRSAPEGYVHLRGNPHSRGEKVEPGFPQVLAERKPTATPLPTEIPSSGRRATLAKWLTSNDNALAARVMANRIWQHHFGRGVVRSPNNFGTAGDKPTHPELLDYLARRLIDSGRRLKPMHREIMLSSAYRMSSAPTAEALKADPTNDLVWRFDRRRLTAEEIRDSLLAVSGELLRRMHGPSVYPTIPKDVLKGQSRPGSGWKKHPSLQDERRRTIYVHVKRSLLLPIVEVFDVAETDRTTPVRFASTQPTQALALFNSEFAHGRAKAFADRLKSETGGDAESRLDRAYRLLFSRAPSTRERDRLLNLERELSKSGASWNDLCLALLNLNEFVYVD
jgi:mono/diheme cytochrome c family protein